MHSNTMGFTKLMVVMISCVVLFVNTSCGFDNILTTTPLLVRLGNGTVKQAAISPDGKILAVAGSLGIWLHDLENSGPPLLLESNVAATSVVWSPDGKTLVSSHNDYTMYVWDVAKGQQVSILKGHANPIIDVAWSPDGTQLVSGDGDEVRVWDIANGQQLDVFELGDKKVVNIVWSSDGVRGVSRSGKTVQVWNVVDDVQLLEVNNSTGVLNYRLSPDGTILAIADANGMIQMWDMNGHRIGGLRDGHTDRVEMLVWSPDSAKLASVSGALRVWDINNELPLHILTGHSEMADFASWSADSKHLVSIGLDNTIRIWDAVTGRQTQILEGVVYPPMISVAWSHDGTRLASTGSYSDTRVWSLAFTSEGKVSGAQELQVFGGDTNVAWSADDDRLATGGLGAEIWDPGTGQKLNRLPGVNFHTKSVAWSPTQKDILASGSAALLMWDVNNGQNLYTLNPPDPLHNFFVTTIAWSPDGTQLASSQAGEIHIWSFSDSGGHILQRTIYPEIMHSIAWSLDGAMLAYGGDDGMVYVWDVANEKLLRAVEGHENGVLSVAWSPSNRDILASSGRDNVIRIWDVGSGQQLAVLQGHTAAVNSVTWSPDGTMIASASLDGTVCVWEVQH